MAAGVARRVSMRASRSLTSASSAARVSMMMLWLFLQSLQVFLFTTLLDIAQQLPDDFDP